MNDADYLLEKASAFVEQKNYLHAIQIYMKFLNNPDYVRIAITHLAEIYDRQNQYDAVVKLFDSYLEQNLDDDDIRTYYAHYLIRHRNFAKANHTLAGLSKEKHPEKNFLMGMVNYYLSDYEIAQINFQDFIKTNPKSDLLPDAYLYLSKSFLKQYELDSALKNAKLSEKLYSQNYQLYETIAIIYYLKEMYFHSNENIRKSLELNPDDPELYEWYGKILYKMGEYEKAEEQLLNYLKLDDPDSETYSLLGMTCLERRKHSDAKKYFDLALKLNPEDEIAQRGIKDCKTSIK